MSLMGAMYSGASGIVANGYALSLVGNNLANLNTVAYKASRPCFGEYLSQSLGGMILGGGVMVEGTTSLWTQGSLQDTGNPTDLAISGNGFFLVSDGTAVYYTRRGEFSVDARGRLVDPHGLVVQGWRLDPEGQAVGALTDVDLSALSAAPQATAGVSLVLNLDASAEPIADPFDPSDASTYHYATAFTAYDSLGNAQQVDIYFVKVDDGSWNWYAYYHDGDGAYQQAGSGSLAFDGNGVLTGGGTGNALSLTGLANGANDLSLELDLSGTTQFVDDFSVLGLDQDGYGVGVFTGLSVDERGVITAYFSNGQAQQLYQLALADFNNPAGLLDLGGGLYASSQESGEPQVGAPGSGSRGTIVAESLEASNVDLTQEFIRMIAAQRAFQASSKVITTADDLLSTLVNLRR